MQYNVYSSIVRLGIVGIILCLLSIIFLQKHFLIEKIIDKIPTNVDSTIGNIALDHYKKDLVDYNKNRQLRIYSSKLLTLLTDKNPNLKFKYKIYLKYDLQVNAFALPGGNIIIHSGLVNTADSVEELLGVIAHEIAHIEMRHALKNLVHKIGVSSLFSVINLGHGSEVVSGLTSSIGDLLAAMHYSRRQEFEADKMGFNYLYNASISPEGLENFFSKLEKNKANTNYMDSVFSTHPDNKTRMARIDQLTKASSNKKYQTPNFDLMQFKKLLKVK